MTIWLSLILSAAAFGSFSWALQGHFRSNGRPPTGMVLLSAASLLSYLSYVVLLCRSHRSSFLTVGQWMLFAISLALFWWTIATTRASRLSLAHSSGVPDNLYESGPYRYVRHPFYLSYIIFWTGTALAAGAWQWLWAAVLGTWYIWVARREEQMFGNSPMSDAYARYRRRVGLVVPRFRNRNP